jgi:hypothetical protein
MPLTVLLAKVLGIGLVVVSALLVIRRRYFVAVFAGYAEQRLLRAVVSMIELLAGLFLIVAHSVWSPPAAAIISLLGWMAVIEATAYMCLGDAAVGKLIATFNTPAWYLAGGLLGVAAGLYLAGFGFGWW